jgi:hypothetical protein
VERYCKVFVQTETGRDELARLIAKTADGKLVRRTIEGQAWQLMSTRMSITIRIKQVRELRTS